MRTPHGEDLFMSCISELVLETREVCHLAFPIHFSSLTKNNHSINLAAVILAMDEIVIKKVFSVVIV